MSNLSVDFKDDILASSNPKRKYQLIHNSDGTVSLEDVTVYQQNGSNFGAKEVNEERTAINKINNDRIVSLDEIDLVNQPGFFVDALAVKELNSTFRVVQFQTGQYTDTEYEIPLPDGWEFWNTMLLNFSIVFEGNLRDAIHMGVVNVWSSSRYTIKNAKATSSGAWALIYKFR